MKKIIITGATSGLGRELAVQLAEQGYTLGLVGRRTAKLEALKHQLGEKVFITSLDVTQLEVAAKTYDSLIQEMGGLDIMILNAGVGIDKRMPAWDAAQKTIEVNVLAFTHGAEFAYTFFKEQGYGHIVGMSSIASLLASGKAAAYTASKHFISNYMTGLRQRARHKNKDITVTDIRPGFVASEMTENLRGLFWVAPTDKAVRQMIKAIEAKRNHVYITKRWRLIAWAAKLVPQFVWDRL